MSRAITITGSDLRTIADDNEQTNNSQQQYTLLIIVIKDSTCLLKCVSEQRICPVSIIGANLVISIILCSKALMSKVESCDFKRALGVADNRD